MDRHDTQIMPVLKAIFVMNESYQNSLTVQPMSSGTLPVCMPYRLS